MYFGLRLCINFNFIFWNMILFYPQSVMLETQYRPPVSLILSLFQFCFWFFSVICLFYFILYFNDKLIFSRVKVFFNGFCWFYFILLSFLYYPLFFLWFIVLIPWCYYLCYNCEFPRPFTFQPVCLLLMGGMLVEWTGITSVVW